mgnify:CR=1 FL=1
MNIAVTGCFGGGKSTVSRLLASALDSPCLDTDRICRRLLQPGEVGHAAFTDRFGGRFLAIDGAIDRLALRQAVFSDVQIKSALEEILHPLVQSEVAEASLACRQVGRFLVVEVPLLFEVGWQGEFDVVVVVGGGESLLAARVARRDGLAAAEIREVATSQWTMAEKVARGDVVIDNGGTFVATVQQVAWLARKLRLADKNVGERQRPAKTLDSRKPSTYKGSNVFSNPCLC